MFRGPRGREVSLYMCNVMAAQGQHLRRHDHTDLWPPRMSHITRVSAVDLEIARDARRARSPETKKEAASREKQRELQRISDEKAWAREVARRERERVRDELRRKAANEKWERRQNELKQKRKEQRASWEADWQAQEDWIAQEKAYEAYLEKGERIERSRREEQMRREEAARHEAERYRQAMEAVRAKIRALPYDMLSPTPELMAELFSTFNSHFPSPFIRP